MNLKSLKGKRIALIGGAGFIGHNVALKLKAMGAEVHIIDGLQINNLLFLHQHELQIPNKGIYIRFIEERLKLLREADIPLHVEDARNYHALSVLLNEKINAEIVVLLAAVSHANRSNKDPFTTFDHSMRTLENALDSSRGRVEQFIFFSSSMVYGDFATGSVDEETVCNPKGIYGALKFGGEKLVIAYNQVFDLPYTIIRPSALYGERCVSRRVLQIFTENAIQGKEININGDGSDKLDFTYIEDLAHGVIRTMEHPDAINDIFNLTYGEARSLADAADIIKGIFPDLKINYLPKDELMPERGTLSVEKARRMIGYNPQNPIEMGLPKYIEWCKTYKDRLNDV